MPALKLSVLIFALIILVTSIINIIFYNNASKGVCSGISVGFATFMMWVNIIFVVLTVGIFIWTMIKLFRKKPQTVVAKEPVQTKTVAPVAPAAPAVQDQPYRRVTTVEEPVSVVRTTHEEENRKKISTALSRQIDFD